MAVKKTRKNRKHLLPREEMLKRLTNEINAGLGRRYFQRAHTAVFLDALREVILESLREGKGLRLGFVAFDFKTVPPRHRYDAFLKTIYSTPEHRAVKTILPREIRDIGKPLRNPVKPVEKS